MVRESGVMSRNRCKLIDHHLLLWGHLPIGRIIFLTREKSSFAILIGRIIFFTCENHRSLLWLARTNLCTKIYGIPFWWVFLSMYIIKLTVKRWKGWLAVLSPLERYSSCRSYRWCNSCCLSLSLHQRTDNFDCKLASRWFLVGFGANYIDRIFLKHRQSVFPLFVGFVCSVIDELFWKNSSYVSGVSVCIFVALYLCNFVSL